MLHSYRNIKNKKLQANIRFADQNLEQTIWLQINGYTDI